MTNQQLMAAVYRAELRLESHKHNVDPEHSEQLETTLDELEQLRKELTPNTYFGELE